jgi:hypothetical protein
MAILIFAPLVLGGCGESVTYSESDAEGATAALPSELVQVKIVDHLDEPCHEPMVVQHPNGTLFVAGFGATPNTESQPLLWRSTDVGTTWERVDVGTADDGAMGNSDVDLAMGPDGTLYFISMGFSWQTFEGERIAIGVSSDEGANWTWTVVSEDRYDDRPWIEVAPDGTAHAIWNDGAGINHVVSTDNGHTWEELDRVHPAGGSSHLAIGPAGELAVRVTPLSASGHRYDEGLELIAVSDDRGHSWVTHDVPGDLGPWDTTFVDPDIVQRWVEPLAWDESGALCHLWSEGDEVKLGRSTDRGASWTTWVIANDGRVAYFPFLIARGSGELAATWFTGTGDELAVNVALIRTPPTEGGEPAVVRSGLIQPDTWMEAEGISTRDTAGEYVPIVFLGDSKVGVVTALRNMKADQETRYVKNGDRQGFTWREFEGQ